MTEIEFSSARRSLMRVTRAAIERAAALLDCDRTELPLLAQWQVNQVARALQEYGDERAREARAAAIEELREPTDEMRLRAAQMTGVSPGVAAVVWREMYALAAKPGGEEVETKINI